MKKYLSVMVICIGLLGLFACKKKSKNPTTKPNTSDTTIKPTTSEKTTTDNTTTETPPTPTKQDLVYAGSIDYNIDYPEYFDNNTSTYRLTNSEYNNISNIFSIKLELDYDTIDNVVVKEKNNKVVNTNIVKDNNDTIIDFNKVNDINSLEIENVVINFKEDYDYIKTTIDISKKLELKDNYIANDEEFILTPIKNHEVNGKLDLKLGIKNEYYNYDNRTNEKLDLKDFYGLKVVYIDDELDEEVLFAETNEVLENYTLTNTFKNLYVSNLDFKVETPLTLKVYIKDNIDSEYRETYIYNDEETSVFEKEFTFTNEGNIYAFNQLSDKVYQLCFIDYPYYIEDISKLTLRFKDGDYQYTLTDLGTKFDYEVNNNNSATITIKEDITDVCDAQIIIKTIDNPNTQLSQTYDFA